jgi:hypothetical protein
MKIETLFFCYILSSEGAVLLLFGVDGGVLASGTSSDDRFKTNEKPTEAVNKSTATKVKNLKEKFN